MLHRFRRHLLLLLIFAFILPVAAHAAFYAVARPWPTSWASADWSSAGMMAPASETPEAVVQVYAARAGRWRGIFAVHSWIVVKPEDAPRYRRYDVVGWGNPVRIDMRAPDARWFGNDPEVLADIRGPRAAALIPRVEAAVAEYRFRNHGDYRVWPGPNSNTFVAAVLSSVPELDVQLPPTALGKDFPAGERSFGLTPSRTGVWLSLVGYAGVRIAWVEGVEINLLGLVLGLDLRRPALKLPGIGRVGMPA